MRIFDRYVIVGWSASSSPCTGKDSIWICVLDADGTRETCNPESRGRAEAQLRRILQGAVDRGERVLLGCDFPYAYPAGFGAALGLPGPSWSTVWSAVGEWIEDAPTTNVNNRFEVAAQMNSRLDHPVFWGRPLSKLSDGLSHKRDQVTYRSAENPSALAEWRGVEMLLRSNGWQPQPTWKLYGNGSVGSQTLTGIPVVARLRGDGRLAPYSRVWPFEVDVPHLRSGDPAIIHAEIWPTVVSLPTSTGMVRDKLQVITLAAEYRRRDADGTLAAAFAAGLSPSAREEGWILGVDDHLTLSGASAWTPAETRSGAGIPGDVTVEADAATDAHGPAPGDLDKARAAKFVSAIPKGRWASYGDVALAGGDHRPMAAYRVGTWFAQSGGSIPRYWRVLNVKGEVPKGFRGGGDGPRDASAANALLLLEGVKFNAAGRAPQSQRFRPEHWDGN